MNDSKPNFLIIMTDQQRGDTVGPGGRAITPHIDGLAREGVTFTEAYCPSPHCCPSRATFMTGLYPSRHGVWNNICNDWAHSRGLLPGVRCWSEDLRDAGYRLGYAGKWHVSTVEGPGDRGFEAPGRTEPDSPNAHGRTWKSYGEMASKGDSGERGEGQLKRPGWGDVQLYGSWKHSDERRLHDEAVADQAKALIGSLSASDDPWCVYSGFTMPHDPFMVSDKYLDRYKLEDIPLPPSYADEMEGKPGLVRRIRRDVWGQLSEREVRETIRHYLAMCSWLDDLVGELLAELEKTGQADNTVVLFCSDHGDYMGDHGLFAKGIPCYRGAYHVPAIVRWPDGIARPGRTVDRFVSLADFAPTFRELAGSGAEALSSGASLAPFLRDQEPSEWRDAVFTQCDGVELYYTQRSVMTREHKLVFNGFDEDELYDLRNDPHEMVNQAGNPDYEEIRRSLYGRLWDFALRENDKVPNPYLTVAFAPYGPGYPFSEADAPQ